MPLRVSHRALLICAALAYQFTAHAISDDALPEEDYSNWYQVEVAVFRPRDMQANGEIWPLTSFNYPKDMISVGSIDVKPDSIHQLRQLIEFEKMLPREQEVIESPPVAFLFEQSSRQQRNQQLLQEELQNEMLLDVQAGNPERLDIANTVDHRQLRDMLTRPRPEAFRELESDQLNLGGVSSSLQRSSQFDLLSHRAWLQPLTTKGTPILIQTGKRYDHFHEVEGTLTFSLSRYLHVDANLWFTEFTPRYNQQKLLRLNNQDIDEETRKAYPELVAHAREHNTHLPLQSYRMSQSRRMRSNEMHYLDHPFFGVFIKILRYQPTSE